MYKIVVTRKIPGIEQAEQILPRSWQLWVNPSEQPLTRSELIEQVRDADAILVCDDRIGAGEMAELPNLKVLCNYGWDWTISICRLPQSGGLLLEICPMR